MELCYNCMYDNNVLKQEHYYFLVDIVIVFSEIVDEFWHESEAMFDLRDNCQKANKQLKYYE